MKIRIISLFFVFIFHAFVFAADTSIETLLPSPGFSEGWIMEGKVNSYTKDTLYEHINGESELYFPYGFEIVGSALYVKISDPNIALVADIFKMGSLLDAFGIYSNYRIPYAEEIKIGSEGFVTSSQLMFYKDRYFVRLAASGTLTLERAVFVACAEAIAKNLPGESSRPKELEILKIPDVTPKTEKYVTQSVLGYAFLKKGFIAEATLDGKPVRVFVILDESPKASIYTFEQYIKYLNESGVQPYLSKSTSGATITVQDPLYKGVMVRQSGRYLLGVINLKDPLKAASLIDRLQSHISAP
ncbi:MAG: hypothetical protein OEW69_00015 [Nitrospirota bacterium]|nr:hypothetical protein [Nitrospirota bacterium]